MAIETTLRFLRHCDIIDPDIEALRPVADAAAQLVTRVTEAVTIGSQRFAFEREFGGFEVIPEAGTMIARDGDLEIRTPYDNNTEAFVEGLEVLLRLWNETEPVTHKGEFYEFENISITPKPIQNPIPTYVASFSQPSIELAGRLGLNNVVAPFASGPYTM